MPVTQNITLDVAKNGIQAVVTGAVKGESSARGLVFNLCQDGVTKTPSALNIDTAIIRCKKPGGTYYVDDCTVGSENITYTIPQDLTVFSGEITAELELNSTTSTLFTPAFTILVSDNVVSTAAVIATSQYPSISNAVSLANAAANYAGAKALDANTAATSANNSVIESASVASDGKITFTKHDGTTIVTNAFVDSSITSGGDNPVAGGKIYTALAGKASESALSALVARVSDLETPTIIGTTPPSTSTVGKVNQLYLYSGEYRIIGAYVCSGLDDEDYVWNQIYYADSSLDHDYNSTNAVQNRIVTKALDGKVNTSDVEDSFVENSTNPVQSAVIKAELDLKANASAIPTVDSDMSDSSPNPVQNKVIKEYVDVKAIKIRDDPPTEHSEGEVGSIYLVDPGGSNELYICIDVNEGAETTYRWELFNPAPDANLSGSSTNAVQNKAVKEALDDKMGMKVLTSAPTSSTAGRVGDAVVVVPSGSTTATLYICSAVTGDPATYTWTQIVDLSSYVKKTDIATSSAYGLMKFPGANVGISRSSQASPTLSSATEAAIKSKNGIGQTGWGAITPSNIQYLPPALGLPVVREIEPTTSTVGKMGDIAVYNDYDEMDDIQWSKIYMCVGHDTNGYHWVTIFSNG